MEDSDWSACEIDFINTAKLDKNFISSIYKKQLLIMLKVYSLGRANTTSCVFCQCSKLVHLDIWIYMCVFFTFNRVNAPGESFFVTPSPRPSPPSPPPPPSLPTHTSYKSKILSIIFLLLLLLLAPTNVLFSPIQGISMCHNNICCF